MSRLHGVLGLIRAPVVALSWLTRLPVPAVGHRDEDLRAALAAFPLVGAVVGLVVVAVRWGADAWWGAGAATVAAVIAGIVVTGALHEDGLADTVDGLWGGGDPGRRREIMRDSRVGTYGVLAVVAAVALRIGLLVPLDVEQFARAAVVAHVLARLAMVGLAAWAPCLPDSSAALVARPASAAVAVAFASGMAVPFALLGWRALAPLVAVAAVTAGVAAVARDRIGGLSGDVLGASAVVGEVAALAAVTAMG